MKMRYTFVCKTSDCLKHALALGALFLMMGWGLTAQAQDIYVDASNTCPGAGTQPDPYCEIQTAINNASAGDLIDVAAGTYAEEITVPVAVTIEGANAGTPGNDSRSSESRIVPASDGQDALMTVQASDVTLDGLAFDSDNPGLAGNRNGSGGIIIPSNSTGSDNVTVTNSLFENFPNESNNPLIPFGGGVAGIASGGNASTGNEISRNLFRNFEGYEFPSGGNAEKASVGISLADNFYATVESNVMENVAFGVLMFGIAPASPNQSITGGSISNVHRGIVLYPGDRDAAYDIENVSIDEADEFGIVAFRFDGSGDGLGDGSNDITTSISDATITNTGKIQPDASGIATNAFGNLNGELNTTVVESTVRDSRNRGINARGADDAKVFVTVERSLIEGSGWDPESAANANGIIAQRGAEVTVSNSVVSNESSSQSAPDADGVSVKAEGAGGSGADSGIMTVTDSQILAPVGNAAASENGNRASLDASGNWWGTTDAGTLTSDINDAADAIDYSPFLNDGTDTDTGTPGFQGDFSVLNLDSASPDVQSGSKLREAVALGGSDNIILQTTGGTYDVPVIIVMPGRLTLADDNLDFSGSGTISVANDELVVESGVTTIANSATFELQSRFTGTDGPGNDAGWRILSAPRAGMTGADIGQTLAQASSGSILYTWDGSQQGFVQQDLDSSADLSAGQGFFLYLFDIGGRDQIDADPSSTCQPGDACIRTDAALSFADPVSDAFGVADVEVSIPDKDNDTATEAGHVLGNPFSQSFDPENLILQSSGSPLGAVGKFVASVQAWNPQTEQFEVINTNPSNRNVAPWQGFWILRAEGSSLNTETLTFESVGRTTGAPFIPAKSTTSAPMAGQILVQMRVDDTQGNTVAQSQTSLYAHENAQPDLDVYDAPRITPPNASYAQISFVRESDSRRQAQHSVPYDLDEHVEIPLHAEAVGLSGTATISTEDWTNIPDDWTLTLEDTETGAQTPLVPGETYTFDLEDSGSGAGGIGGGVQGDAVDNPRFIVRAGPEAPLPVELTTFNGQADGQAAVLSWTTASETNNAGFNVQQQTEGGSYETVEFVEGAGTTDTPQSYQTRVDDLSYGAHTFRVEQVDTDGTATPSEPVDVEVRLQDAMAVTPMAPNPVRGQGTARVTVRETQPVQVHLYDALGRRVRTLYDGELQGQQPETLQVEASTLASGTYFLRVQGEDATQTTRFVVVR